MSTENAVSEVRPHVTFDMFKPHTPKQELAKQNMSKLAQSIVARGRDIKSKITPFDRPRLVVLWGKPGRGKTHLVEALINHVRASDQMLLSRIFLERRDVTITNSGVLNSYWSSYPIIILDDLFSSRQNVERLCRYTDIPVLMKAMTSVYDNRTLVIATTNFPFTSGIVGQVEQVDKIGRTLSRLKEILAGSGEMEIDGEDYREEIARTSPSADIFSF